MARSFERDQGSVMVNTLAVLAVAASVTLVMLSAQDGAIDRAQRFADAGQALEIAHGAEDSARAALRRDLEEPVTWPELRAGLEEQDAAIGPGRFSMRIEDAQARFNINNLASGGTAARGVFERLAGPAGFQPDEIGMIADFVRAAAPLDDLQSLALIGMTAERIDALSRHVTALPERTLVNMNTAEEAVLAAHLNNAPAARALVMRRGRIGYVDRDVLSSLRILPGPGLGYRSHYYLVSTEVTVDGARQAWVSLIWRGQINGAPATRILSRHEAPLADQ